MPPNKTDQHLSIMNYQIKPVCTNRVSGLSLQYDFVYCFTQSVIFSLLLQVNGCDNKHKSSLHAPHSPMMLAWNHLGYPVAFFGTKHTWPTCLIPSCLWRLTHICLIGFEKCFSVILPWPQPAGSKWHFQMESVELYRDAYTPQTKMPTHWQTIILMPNILQDKGWHSFTKSAWCFLHRVYIIMLWCPQNASH